MLERNNEVARLGVILNVDLSLVEIIMTYYNEKERPEQDSERLQSVKMSLLEENEKIKIFKEALKRKLLLYQQRIQFLKVFYRTIHR